MKCIRCGKQNDYRTRKAKARACAQCGGAFAFEPREGDPLTDLAFHNAIAAVSDDGRLAWLERQLYYEIARRVRRRRPVHRLFRRRGISIDDRRFATLLARWIKAYGPLSGVLRPDAFAIDVRGAERASDAAAYGFDRLIVCGKDAIVDVLLANGFHGDHKCAVLGAGGYPAWAYELVMPRLRETPPATIVVLHDADLDGCRLADEVRSGPHWFRGAKGVEILDAGLRPGDARRFRGVYLAGSAADVNVLVSPVSVEEARWLAKHRLELEAVRPRALIAVLAGVVSGREDPTRAPADDGGWWDGGAWGLGADGGDGDDGDG